MSHSKLVPVAVACISLFTCGVLPSHASTAVFQWVYGESNVGLSYPNDVGYPNLEDSNGFDFENSASGVVAIAEVSDGNSSGFTSVLASGELAIGGYANGASGISSWGRWDGLFVNITGYDVLVSFELLFESVFESTLHYEGFLSPVYFPDVPRGGGVNGGAGCIYFPRVATCGLSIESYETERLRSALNSLEALALEQVLFSRVSHSLRFQPLATGEPPLRNLDILRASLFRISASLPSLNRVLH
jgi:hypothetical protein